MHKKGTITHSGIIREVNKKNILVSIVTESACAGCHAKGQCTVADLEEKEVEIPNKGQVYAINDRVTVYMSESSGFKALFIGYIIPFVVLLATLVVGLHFIGDEGIAGLISIGMLVPYYLIVFLFRKKIKKGFSFFIEK